MDSGWTSAELRTWRGRLGWTQARAAEALCYHVEAYKRLEAGTRAVAPRTRRLCLLVEREHVRSLYHVAGGDGSGRLVYSTAERARARMDSMEAEGKLVGRGGRPRLRYLSLFSGLCACTAAMERIGSDAVCVGYADTDPAANAVQRHRWPDTPRLGDVTEVDWAALRGMVDLVVGGPPCQAFSVSGRRLGLADPRGNLVLHYLRVVDAVKPRWFLMENVPGLRGASGGADFGVFLDEVEKLGYAVAWRELDARGFGLPQRRRRLWVVGEHSGSASGPLRALALPEGDGRSAAARPPPRGSRWKSDALRAEGCPDEPVGAPPVDWSEASAWLQERAAAVPADIPAPRTVGGAIAFRPNQGPSARGSGASASVVPTLAAVSGGNRTPAVAYTHALAADLRHGTLADVASTLQVGPASGWSLHAQPVAVHPDGAGRHVVRRLSVLECERLQGLDDGWTQGARLNGSVLRDGDRYRLVGNAWAVPVAAWIFERLLGRHYA
jgi:DNA (cytosine-5)-methyltransferase 1